MFTSFIFAGITPVPVTLTEVAFHAYHSADACYNAGTTLLFDTVTVNIGRVNLNF